MSRIRKAIVAALVAFVGSLLTAARAGTVVYGERGVNWAAIGVALGAAVAAFAATWAVRNAPPQVTARRREEGPGRSRYSDGGVVS
jgi:hypothetical protein